MPRKICRKGNLASQRPRVPRIVDNASLRHGNPSLVDQHSERRMASIVLSTAMDFLGSHVSLLAITTLTEDYPFYPSTVRQKTGTRLWVIPSVVTGCGQ